MKLEPARSSDLLNADLVFEIVRANEGEPVRAFQCIDAFISALGCLASRSVPGGDVHTLAVFEHNEARSVRVWLDWDLPDLALPEESCLRTRLSGLVVTVIRRLMQPLTPNGGKDFAVEIANVLSPASQQDLLEIAESFWTAMAHLGATDQATLTTENTSLNCAASPISSEEIIRITAAHTITNVVDLLLRIHSMNYESGTGWTFSHGDECLVYDIEDREWMQRFSGRQIDARPGDLIKATVEQQSYYGGCGNLIKISRRILFMKEVKTLGIPSIDFYARKEPALTPNFESANHSQLRQPAQGSKVKAVSHAGHAELPSQMHENQSPLG